MAPARAGRDLALLGRRAAPAPGPRRHRGADTLAAHVTSINISEHQATALCALVGHASTAALTDAVDDVAVSKARAKVLLAMAKARPLEQQDADRIDTAAPSIGIGSLEADVLGALLRRRGR